MSTLRFFLLGPAQFTQADRPVELNTAKAVGLLAYLAITGTSQTRDRLADLLWPESMPDAARKNLRNTLWAIRKALGDEVLQGDAERMALSDTVWVDVHAFQSSVQSGPAAIAPDAGELETAVELYRGPLLDGLTVSEAPDFEIWLATERERFGQLYLRALDALAAAYRASANWRGVIAIAQRALVYDNLQEPMYRALMEAHARLGERAEALRQYDLLHTTLARELGVEPLPETEALREAILGGNLRSTESPTPAAPARARHMPEPDRHASPPFIGRQAERAALDQELELATRGQARVVLITGEIGIGKSRLWQEWSAALPPGLTVLETRCLNTTQSLPLAPLIGLFRRRACLEKLLVSPSPVSPIWLAELARLLPEIRQHWPALPAPPVLPPEEERPRLFEAFTQTLRALKGRPLILFIDDLHWADHTTLDWLVYLVDRMPNEPLLLVSAYRPTDTTAQLNHLVVGWGEEGIVRRLPLGGLTLEEAITLVEALGGDVALAGQLHARSAGNPYFLIELSRAAPGSTPPRLAELVGTRLSQLPGTTRQVLQAAAVLEADFDFNTLRRTSGRGEEETLDALDALLDAVVLVEREGYYEFAHPLVASIVRDDLSIARRSFLHRRAAEALEATYAGRLALIAGQLATHYAQAGHPAKSAHYAELAAEHALELSAPAEAVAFYRQAFSLEPTLARQMGLGHALYIQGDLEGARDTFCEALAEFESQGDRPGVVQACLALAETYLPSGQGERVIQWAERALPSVDAKRYPEACARVHYLLGAGSLISGRSLVEAEAHLLKAIDLATENDLPEIAARGRLELGNLLAQRGDLTQALGAFEETIMLARAARERLLEILGHNNLAYHAQLAGDLATAHEHIQTALALAEARSFFLPLQYLYSTRGEIALAEGLPDEAEVWFKRALAEAEKYGNQLQAANIRANLGLVARARGDLEQALDLLETAQSAVAATSATHLQTQIDLWLAELHLQRGERAAAEESLTQAEARLAGGERQGLQAWAQQVRDGLHH
jgi:DNA-binding SARP family transcriptional activator